MLSCTSRPGMPCSLHQFISGLKNGGIQSVIRTSDQLWLFQKLVLQQKMQVRGDSHSGSTEYTKIVVCRHNNASPRYDNLADFLESMSCLPLICLIPYFWVGFLHQHRQCLVPVQTYKAFPPLHCHHRYVQSPFGFPAVAADTRPGAHGYFPPQSSQPLPPLTSMARNA